MYHLVPVILCACFSPWQLFQCVTRSQPNDQQPDTSMHSNM